MSFVLVWAEKMKTAKAKSSKAKRDRESGNAAASPVSQRCHLLVTVSQTKSVRTLALVPRTLTQVPARS